MSYLVDKAISIATFIHRNQVRQGSGKPYIIHPLEVGEIVAREFPDLGEEGICAGILHDVLEDASPEDLVKAYDSVFELGRPIYDLTVGLTKITSPADGNRAYRSNIERLRLSVAPLAVQKIKLADIYSNSRDAELLKGGFRVQFLAEKLVLMGMMDKVHRLPFYETVYNLVQSKRDLRSGT